jgi:D-arabinose 1-dehydrogenase-like Zn-dependent alcohol dehydrogenase
MLRICPDAQSKHPFASERMTAMEAIVVKEIGAVGFMEKPVPTASPNDAIAALVCKSDSHTVSGGVGRRKDWMGGHGAIGVVAEVRSAVDLSGSTKWKDPSRRRTRLRTW